MSKKKPILYTIGKSILGPFFKWYYKPQIKGTDNIPLNGGIIIAGNHVHLYDQCHTIISTKRNITYMAKKEYFDNWKTRWFFKGVGCIPVDRSKKDIDAVSKAIELLNEESAIGIFPEGTRNALKEKNIKEIYDEYFNDIEYNEFKTKLLETKPKLSHIQYLIDLFNKKIISKKELKQNIYTPDSYLLKLVEKKKISFDDYLDSCLLELKFGAVSMAKKTKSVILPVCITGDYVFHSKNLKVNYGKPFSVQNLELEDANNKLRRELIKLMKENLRS